MRHKDRDDWSAVLSETRGGSVQVEKQGRVRNAQREVGVGTGGCVLRKVLRLSGLCATWRAVNGSVVTWWLVVES